MLTTRVLLVEDEVLLRMMVADMVEELGHAIAAEAGDVDTASKLAEDGQFDLAILDVNLNGKLSFPVADIIRSRHLPLIFATGYAVDSFPEAYRATPCLRKPFQVEALAQAINVAIDPGRIN